MASTLVVLASLAVIAIAWLSQQRLTAKPWLEQGATQDMRDAATSWPAAKVGLGVFLAVVGTLFGLCLSAYSIRMGGSDWRPLPNSGLLLFNTVLLLVSSAALQWAKTAAGRGELDGVKVCLGAGAIFALGFLAGQAVLWRQLTDAGYLLAANPANAFFYLITGLHGLHLAGGLVALGRTADRVRSGSDGAGLRLSVALCATYWHFLLLVWLVLLVVLTGWAGDFASVCRQWLA
jgi:cytochrome c oxidase subunit 3